METIKSVCLYLFLLLVAFAVNLKPLNAQVLECNDLNEALIKYGSAKFMKIEMM